MSEWSSRLQRWSDAGLIDEATADSIRAFERASPPAEHTAWPVRLALAFGALAVGAGVLLFVSAHWDELSPAFRFSLVLLLTGMFHLAGAVAVPRLPTLATALHAIGTLALGAGVFLTGQIFHLNEHWPGGVMVWAFGAAIGWLVLGDRPQFALTAILLPAWLIAEWAKVITDLARPTVSGVRIMAMGPFLMALAYFVACDGHRARAAADRYRGLLVRLGTIALIPAAAGLGFAANDRQWLDPGGRGELALGLATSGWIVAIGAPLAVALLTRGPLAWHFALAIAWTFALWPLRQVGEVTQFVWWATGSVALVGWGVREGRVERINMGAAFFAATVLAFYLSQVMDKIGRSLSLLIVGMLFLGGGAALERMRRRLVANAVGTS